ncbi:MAG: hypothetical protein RJQ01_06365 [Microcella sp.]|uniref:hypothetical protein n=1 Tax=Microcella sp. TaxID=1913979 RepID=UPI003315120C
MTTWWRSSAIDVDTLSWLTSSLVTIWVPIVVAVQGVVSITAGGQAGRFVAAQILALLLFVAAGILTHVGSRPYRGRLGAAFSITVFVLTALGVLVSAAGLQGEAVVPELWWASLAAALIAMSLAPFLPGRVFLPGMIGLTACTIVGALGATGGEDVRLPVAAALTATSPVLFATIGGSVLTGIMIADVVRWRALVDRGRATDAQEEPVVAVLERVTAGAWSQRMQPFLRSIALAEEVSDRDRRRAAALADELRRALVARDAESWLSGIVAEWPVHVDDPHRLADTITVDQRSAITALITGLFSDPEAGVFGARLRLAAAGDDAVAVAVTVSLDLPEGRRTTVLAPYYLSVRSVVRRIEWRNGESLVVSFDVDAAGQR